MSLCTLLALSLFAPPVGAAPSADRAAIVALLDGFHAAASEADGAAYFAALTPDAVFVGTDATEVWTKRAFRAFAEPYFAKGKGWTYLPDRAATRIRVNGAVGWFYEPLHNEKYGAVRGSGVVVKTDGRWRIAQYVLSFAVPNAAATDVVSRIRRPASP